MRFNTTTVVLALLLTVVWLVGCVDVPSNGPEVPVIESEYRFLNAASDLGSVGITLDLGDGVSGLDFGGSSAHQTYPSGNRLAVLSNGDSLRIAMTAEQRATVMILPKTGVIREFTKLIERRIFDSSTVNTAKIRVAHAGVATAAGALVAGGDLDVTIAGTDTSVTVTVSYGQVSAYVSVPAGSYTLIATASGGTVAVATTTVDASNQRYTNVITGDVSALSFVNLSDN